MYDSTHEGRFPLPIPCMDPHVWIEVSFEATAGQIF